MKIALYSRNLKEETSRRFLEKIAEFLVTNGVEVFIHSNIYNELLANAERPLKIQVFDNENFNSINIDYLISLGGDGTLLDTVSIVKDRNIPVLGINTGRLGFLANVSEDEVMEALDLLLKGYYTLDSRSLLYLESDKTFFNGFHYGLNDFVLHKNDTSSMIVIHTFLNGEFLNSYWSDGLIVSTPTGSTGYSLSCGGPILFPHSESIVITPIAPHNLNVRPIVVPDKNVLSFEVEGRSNSFLISLDSQSVSVPFNSQLAIRRADFELKLIQLKNHNYLRTLRKKLMWGLDNRNYMR